jgi:ATP-dependent RNA helicase DDX3X
MGHRGVATSFYDADRDAPISSVLVRTLLETSQDVPEFLQSYMPEGDDLVNLRWEINSNPDDRPQDVDGGFGGGDFGGGDFGDDGDGGAGWTQDDDAANTTEAPAEAATPVW